MNFHVVLIAAVIGNVTCADTYNYLNWKFHFPNGAGMGLFLALAIPLDLPNKNVYLAYNFQANYMLPGNDTFYEYPPLIGRRINRELVYSALETKMNSTGFPGKPCLLRTICEISSTSLQKHNGVLGDILHIVFTPSTSNNTGLSNDYQDAEEFGKRKGNCEIYNKNCKISFIDLISWIEKSTSLQ